MYKVLIADDEGITVDALNFIIERNFPGKCVIESAKTGREVIEAAETFRPDIAFVDIHMPGINGIDAIREIRKTQPGIAFVIISAYDKFSYAKTAIELGVLKYINKPIEQKQIVEVLQEAIHEIENRREKRSEDLKIREKLENVVPIIENGFIYDLLFKEHFSEDIKKFKDLLGIEEEYGYMLACVFGEQQEGNHMTNAAGTTVYIQKDYKEMRAVIEGYFAGAIVSNTMANKIAVFVPYSNNELDYGKRTELVEIAREMVHSLNHRFNIRTRVGFGSVKPIKEMSESYREAINSLVQTTRSIAHAQDVSVNVGYEKDYPIETERALFRMVEAGNVEESILQAIKFFDWLVLSSGGEESDIKMKVIEFILRAEKVAYETSGMSYIFKSRTDYLSMLISLDIHSELKEWFVEKVRQAAKSVSNIKTEKSSSIIQRAVTYINANFATNISLDDVSREVDVTPYYFSRLFKEEMGLNFIEYVTNLRMEKAKELLSSSNVLSMKEICREAGYTDPNYFSRMFKKHEGFSPTEYREGIRK